MTGAIGELVDRVDLQEVAERLGLDRPGGRGGLWRSPKHDDSNPSLSLYDREGRQRWRDHSTDQGGDAVDLVRYVLGLDTNDALRWLREAYGIPAPQRDAPPAPRSLPEAVGARVLGEATGAGRERIVEYLGGRGIDAGVIDAAIRRKTLGWSSWVNSKVPAGQAGHGGPGVALVVKRIGTGELVGVDTRYLDPAANGGSKSRRLPGDSSADPWHAGDGLKCATVYIVESPINALSVLSAGLKSTTALAVRSIHHAPKHDWRFLRGKRVILCFDNDTPDEQGRRAGPEAAWTLYGLLSELGIATHLVDQGDWEHNDINDILQAEGADALRGLLGRLEPWAIAGVRGDGQGRGRARVWLPAHDLKVYWRYRCKEDAISFVKRIEEDEHGQKREDFQDLAGFRIAQIGRVDIASPESVLSGRDALGGGELFVAVTQDPYHGAKLQRHVGKYKQINSKDWWGNVGPVYLPGPFLRLVSILGRASELRTAEAVNFVGLCWRGGQLAVSEAEDCYFSDPERQCVYHDLRLPRGPVHDGRRVVAAFRDTFGRHAALLLLAWALGGHLKAVLGFWPHVTVQARKGSGKSTLVRSLERAIGMRMLSSETLSTRFRILTSVNGTSHPVGWDELSTKRDDEINTAVSILQQCYQSAVTYWGADRLAMLHSAPVLLAGEDVPVNSLIGKVVRITLEERGPLIPEDLPPFPVRAWLEHLAAQDPAALRQRYRDGVDWAGRLSLAAADDAAAARMIGNYAAVGLAWNLLADWLDIEDGAGPLADLVREMNHHISQTEASREPWCWIVEVILAEISAGRYALPYAFETLDGVECLVIRPSHMMHYIRSTSGLRDVWNGLPIKSSQILRQQLHRAGVIHHRRDRDGQPTERVDITINQKREGHMTALNLEVLDRYSLHASRPELPGG